MQIKIGVFGSAEGDIEHTFKKARQLGEILASKNVIIITGACGGIPYQAAYAAYKKGAQIWGYSPYKNFKAHTEGESDYDNNIYKKLFFIPKNIQDFKNILVSRKYRNVISCANCDGGIIICGRWGTMNEFTNLFDLGKVIGVLIKTGGVADELLSLNKKLHKISKAKVIFSSSPQKLVNMVIDELKKRAA